MDALSEFHFLRPGWLWLLAAAPLIVWLASRFESRRNAWTKAIDPELLKDLIAGPEQRARWRPEHSAAVALTLAAIALAGPAWRREVPPFTEDNAPLAIAVDLSPEMDAIDVSPTRIERAKLKIRDLLELRQGARTALFAYAGSAHMVLPLTNDPELLTTYLDALSTGLMPHPGKNTRLVLQAAAQMLGSQDVAGTVLLVTDGVETEAFSTARQFTQGRDNLLVLAVGTSAGGPVAAGPNRFLEDASGRRVFAKLDIEALKRLKSEAGVDIVTMTLDGSDVAWVQRHVQSHLKAAQARDAKVRWQDDGYWLLVPIVILAALWFRKGWTLRWAAVVLLFWQPGWSADFRFIDLWLTKDQQGRLYFERGDYATAASRFTDPAWRGVALYRLGKYEEAINEFARSDSAEAWFNQGDALAQLKKYPEAASAFENALKRRAAWPEAAANLKLMRSLIPKKEDDDEGDPDPALPPDEVKFDDKGKKGKAGEIPRQKFDDKTMAEIWMRNIQTTPADFLRRKFAIQAAHEGRK